MAINLVQYLFRSLQTPALARRYSDAAIGFVLIFSIQVLILPVQIALDLHAINLPASILVMLLVLVSMTVASLISSQVAPFYNKHLLGPTDFVGRHMSFGFVAFFILLIRDHINRAPDVPKLAGVFVITFVMSYVASFLLGAGGCRLEQRLRQSSSRQSPRDLETGNRAWPSPSIAWPAPSVQRLAAKRISPLSSLSEALSTRDSLMKITPLADSPAAASIDFVLRTAPIWICLTLLIAVGLPVYLATDYAMPFDVFAFALIWALSVQCQRSVRASYRLRQHRHLRSFLIIFANPLLLTWGLGTIYVWSKTLYTRKSIHTIVGQFSHYNSLSQSIIHIVQDHDVVSNLGAGDLASLLLDAGVACMGFKMYEYRLELWASLGTVSFTCTTLAAINVFLNVLVGHGLGLRADEAIAFAGRSATLALGIPAVENLGGSTTLPSTIAIFNGILFQMLGDSLFSLLRIDDRRLHGDVSAQRLASSGTGALFCATTTTNTARASSCSSRSNTEKDSATTTGHGRNRAGEDCTVVAAGITAGINAAAMGTAFLVERDSRATAYSALSMIMFGAATVALTALPGAAQITMALTSR